ncbi:phosphate-starvation-inducible PsiE family protein [Acaryochloris marina]|uniref:phosphate-starvation-inducible PsiE family protein n=1 Tax=Acaryochloris marina TaxID=155978 RepID=UPI001BAFE2F5|nr:phosphate-starvation-inducible PsiE family protein [Acaryochloris marina]QUY45504.1 phosphate-starvation-inducible PsiE family protein [Acaryochloris marina S15]QUY45650.1 phosphate-starvation-inducible PsiE family protein [Acaryochloris marina S15]
MNSIRRLLHTIVKALSDNSFVKGLKRLEGAVAKILTLGLILVISFALLDLGNSLFRELITKPYGFFNSMILGIFGLFLNILIALELLENTKAYLDHQGVQVQLVIATALIAMARKLIIFDFAKSSGLDLAGLATAIFSLSISYWLVRQLKKQVE